MLRNCIVLRDFSKPVRVCDNMFNKMFAHLHLALYELGMLTWRCPASSILTRVLIFSLFF